MSAAETKAANSSKNPSAALIGSSDLLLGVMALFRVWLNICLQKANRPTCEPPLAENINENYDDYGQPAQPTIQISPIIHCERNAGNNQCASDQAAKQKADTALGQKSG